MSPSDYVAAWSVGLDAATWVASAVVPFLIAAGAARLMAYLFTPQQH